MIYRPDAAAELAEIWLNADDRRSVTAAANSIDELLGRDPLNAGESREGSSRVLWQDPLIVFFEVIPGDCIVTVWGIHRP